MEDEIVRQLVNKSQEAFIMGVEIYNKPTLKYRVEGFSFFICNAWELLLKAYMIKNFGRDSIYYKNSKNGEERTLNLSNCVEKVLTNKKDPVHINLMRIIALRNTSTHYITEEYEQIYVPLFQACVNNYTTKLLYYFAIDVTEGLNTNFLTLSIKLHPFDKEEIKARYPKEIADKLIETYLMIENSMQEVSNFKYSTCIRHDFYITKDRKEATAVIAIDKNAPQNVGVLKDVKDMQDMFPYMLHKCLEIINDRIKRDKINFVNPTNGLSAEKKKQFNKTHFGLFVKFYSIKENRNYCYCYRISTSKMYSYNMNAIDFIYEEIKKDPEHVIQNLKNAIKKS